MSFSFFHGRKSAERAPTTIRAVPSATPRHTRSRSRGRKSECHCAGSQPKRRSTRSMKGWVSAISGSSSSTWAPEASAAAIASK